MRSGSMKSLLLATAFCEGLCVLVIEIAGARALAPLYGTSLRVWTAQITATLLFLALGYGLGGKLSRRPRPLMLPGVFWIAGIWLGLYPVLRVIVRGYAASTAISAGSFLAAVLLFGVPLLALGAVSPLLIERLNGLNTGAGNAAGTLFFTNTLGGLAGGWFTALVLIPFLSLRLALCGTGVFLVSLGLGWAWLEKRIRAAVLAIVPLALAGGIVIPGSPWGFLVGPPLPRVFESAGQAVTLRYSHMSGSGLIQVIDTARPSGSGDAAAITRDLLIDGTTQGGIDLTTSCSSYDFAGYMLAIASRYCPGPQKALVLGLGIGFIPRDLAASGVRVTAVELDPRVVEVARRFFGLPSSVKVIIGDGRTFINDTTERFDHVYLDVFAGDSVPWYLTSVEALERIHRLLSPDGVLVINSVSTMEGSPGLDLLEADIAGVFPAAMVFSEYNAGLPPTELVNVILVGGDRLKIHDSPLPARASPTTLARIQDLLPRGRPAQIGPRPDSDDRSLLDSIDSPVRIRWRELLLRAVDLRILEEL